MCMLGGSVSKFSIHRVPDSSPGPTALFSHTVTCDPDYIKLLVNKIVLFTH